MALLPCTSHLHEVIVGIEGPERAVGVVRGKKSEEMGPSPARED